MLPELRWGAGAHDQVGGGEPKGAGKTKLGDDNPGPAVTKEEPAERVLSSPLRGRSGDSTSSLRLLASVAFNLLLRPHARATLSLLAPAVRPSHLVLSRSAMDAFAEQQQAARPQAARPPQAEGPLVCSAAASRWLLDHFCPMLSDSVLIDGKLSVSVAVSPATGGMNVLHVIAEYLRDASQKIENQEPRAVEEFWIPLNAILSIPGVGGLVDEVPGSGHLLDRAPYRRRPFF